MDSSNRPSTAKRRAARGMVSLNKSPDEVKQTGNTPFSQRELMSQYTFDASNPSPMIGGGDAARKIDFNTPHNTNMQSLEQRNTTDSDKMKSSNSNPNRGVGNTVASVSVTAPPVETKTRPPVKLDGVSDQALAEVIYDTMQVLQPLLFEATPQLVPKLLAKPPFRYVHDIAVSVSKGKTKFGQGLLDSRPDLVDAKAITSRDKKIEYIKLLSSLITAFHGKPLDLKPGKLVAGAEPIKTNIMLQELARAANESTLKTSQEAIKKALVIFNDKGGDKKKKAENKGDKTSITEEILDLKSNTSTSQNRTDREHRVAHHENNFVGDLNQGNKQSGFASLKKSNLNEVDDSSLFPSLVTKQKSSEEKESLTDGWGEGERDYKLDALVSKDKSVALDPYEARANERLRAVSAKGSKRKEAAPGSTKDSYQPALNSVLSNSSNTSSLDASESKSLAASESMYDFGVSTNSNSSNSVPKVAEVKALVQAASPKMDTSKDMENNDSTNQNTAMDRKWSFNKPTPPSGPRPPKEAKDAKAARSRKHRSKRTPHPPEGEAPGKAPGKSSNRHRKNRHRQRKEEGDNDNDSDNDSMGSIAQSVMSSANGESKKNKHDKKKWRREIEEEENAKHSGITFSDLLDDSDDSDDEEAIRRKKQWSLQAQAKGNQSKAFEDAQKKAERAAKEREAARLEASGLEPSSPPRSPRVDVMQENHRAQIEHHIELEKIDSEELAKIEKRKEKDRKREQKKKEEEEKKLAQELEMASNRALKAMETADRDMAMKKMKQEVEEEERKQAELRLEREKEQTRLEAEKYFQELQKPKPGIAELEELAKKEAEELREKEEKEAEEKKAKKSSGGGFFSSLTNRFSKSKENAANNASKKSPEKEEPSLKEKVPSHEEEEEEAEIEVGGMIDDEDEDWGDDFNITSDSAAQNVRAVEVLSSVERERLKQEEEAARSELKAAEALQKVAEIAAQKAADEAAEERERGRIATEKAELEAEALRQKLKKIEDDRKAAEIEQAKHESLKKEEQEKRDLELRLEREERERQAEFEVNELKRKAEEEALEREKLIAEREKQAASYQQQCEDELVRAKEEADRRVQELDALLQAERQRVEDERLAVIKKREEEEASLAQQKLQLEAMLQDAEERRKQEARRFQEEKEAFEKQRAEMQAQRLADNEELAKQKLKFEEEHAQKRLSLEEEHRQQKIKFEQEQQVRLAEEAAERARIAAEQKNFEQYAESSSEADAGGVPVEPFAPPSPVEQQGEEVPMEPCYSPSKEMPAIDPYEELDEGDKAYADAIAIAERKAEEARWEREAAEREKARERDRMLGFHAGRHCQSLSQLLETGFNTAGEETDSEAVAGAFKDEEEGNGEKGDVGNSEDGPNFSSASVLREQTQVDSNRMHYLNPGTDIEIGCRVELVALRAKTDLNGCIGEVLAWVESSNRFSVSIDGGRGTYDVKPSNLVRTMKPLPSSMSVADDGLDQVEIVAKKARDGLCPMCRQAQREWNDVLRNRRDILNAMTVMELRKLAGDTETDTVGCAGKGDVVDRVLKKCRKPRASPSQSDAFRNAFREFAGTAKGDESDKTYLPGLLCAAAAGHTYCCRTFLKIPGGGGLFKGVKVKLVNLKAKPELNGCTGVIQAYVQNSHRYSVEINGGKGTFDLKPVNLSRITPEITSNQRNNKEEEEEDVLEECPEEYLGAIEVDMSGRTALYHATLENRLEVVKDLVKVCPDASCVADENGDTAIHSAAAFSSASLSLVLKHLTDKTKIDLMNRNGMRPSHLALNLQAFQELNARDCDLLAPDSRGRTPLFIACAMGRFDCAHFLCELLSFDDDYLRTPDDRGDTPLHAAACNGSIKCTRLLLEYGVAPDVSNHAGLRPVDLAARRGHMDCERLLGEYHMHHGVEAANFDSVLFLNTLDGLRQAKEAMNSQDVPYEILKKAKQQSLESSKSAWSLRKKKSMRVQQWGGWIAYEDTELQQVFWYNPKLGTHQWSPPQEVLDLQDMSGTSLPQHHVAMNESGHKFGSAQWKALHMGSMRLKKMGSWIQYSGPGGRPFYYNEETGFFQWERPNGVESFASMSTLQENGGVSGGNVNGKNIRGDKEEEEDDEEDEAAWAYTDADALGGLDSTEGGGGDAAAKWNAAVAAVTDANNGTSAAQGPWEQYEDEEGNWYWYNHETGASQWDTPEGCVDPYEEAWEGEEEGGDYSYENDEST